VALVAAASAAADEEKDRMEEERAMQQVAPARILVTGGSGFVGSALLKRLRGQGEIPRVFLRRPAAAGSAAEGLDAVYGDLGEPDAVDRAVAGVEVVYHVGAAMKGGPFEFEAGTIWGTRNMIDACLRHGVKRLVYVSSIGVLDHAGHKEGVPVNEQSPIEPHPDWRGAYSQTKLQAERLVIDAIRERGLPAVIIRPGQIFGPGAELVTPNGVIRLAGQWIVAGSGNRPIPAVYVEDVVDGLLAAGSSPTAQGQVIHLIDPMTVTQNRYLEFCKPALGKTPVRHWPFALLMTMGWMFDILAGVLKRPLPLSRYKVRSLRPLSPADVSLAKETLGWTPAIGAERGLELTFGRFRQT
jgi:nucleoside-diphosphate-sugar epimerase